MTERCAVDLEPVGRRVSVEVGTTLLDAAQAAGVALVSICGGIGSCGECQVRVVTGRVSPPSLTEEAELSAEALAQSYRLACQTHILGAVRLDIPPTSMTTPQRLQIEGEADAPHVDPVVRAVDATVPPPALDDLRSDATRLLDTLADARQVGLSIDIAALGELSEGLRAQNWRVRLAVGGDTLVAVLPPTSPLLGLAVDVGTTKIAAYLVDLTDGAIVARQGAMNPQIAYGEDVISRIAYCNEHPDGRAVLQARLVDALNGLVAELCRVANASATRIVDAVIVGNTAMHHLLAGLSVSQLGAAPYVAAVTEALEFPARDIGLRLAAGARVYLPPNIAGYVGADHVAMLLATQPDRHAATDQPTVVALDIGTNTEISLFHGGRLLTCSCASGPAFEGAHIHDGMRAAPGAIERVRLTPDDSQVYTIDGARPVGICGSGILDAVAEMYAIGVLDARGALTGDDARLRRVGRRAEFVLAPAATTGHGRDVVVTRRDVNEIQLAKGAIRAGTDVLLAEAGLTESDIDQFVVAGAFGTYLDLNSAVRIGMFPDLPRERFRQVGNAAGAGARAMLLSRGRRDQARDYAQRSEYIELTTHPAFPERYVQALAFAPLTPSHPRSADHAPFPG